MEEREAAALFKGVARFVVPPFKLHVQLTAKSIGPAYVCCSAFCASQTFRRLRPSTRFVVSFKCTGVGSLPYVRALFSSRAVIILSSKIQRVPLEIWDRVASFIPRYFLRKWLFVSSFHRDIALRRVFHTVDLYLGEDANWNRTLDIFDRVRMDPLFSRRIKALRIHWAYDGGDMLEVMSRECKDFRSQNFRPLIPSNQEYFEQHFQSSGLWKSSSG